MALKLIGTYSKRLGLPEYSSHQFSVTIETELTTAGDVGAESTRLYQLLQQSVDEQIQQTGFVPGKRYGRRGAPPAKSEPNGRPPESDAVLWHCTDRQRELILKIIADHQLNKNDVEALSREMFDGLGVRKLEKAEASELIKELLARHGGGGSRPPGNRRPRRATASSGR